MRTSALFLAGLAVFAVAWANPDAPDENPAGSTATGYDYHNDLARVGLIFVAPEGVTFYEKTGDNDWETKSMVLVRASADAETAYSIHPNNNGVLKTVQVFDHSAVSTGGQPKQVAKLSLGVRTTNPGYVVDLGRSIFGLDNPWCVTAVGPLQVSLATAPGQEKPVPTDGCVPLFAP